MTTEEIMSAAASGYEPPGLDPAETLLFCRMKENYRAYRAGEISKAEGAENKIRAMAEYRQIQTRLYFGDSAQYTLAQIWQTMEQATTAYSKNPNLETADRVMEVVYGLVKRKEEMPNG